MDGFLNILQAISDFLWGTPMAVALVGTGVYLSFKFKFRYITKMKFHFGNTFAKAFKKGEGEGSVSGFAAACTAMANTIGIGNIGGVATAITMGGPGAVFWMWISALFGMSTKASEIILGQRYREKFNESTDEYICDRSFVMKNAMGWKKSGVLIAISCFIFGPWTCLVQTNAVTTSLNEAFGINPTLILIILGITVAVTIIGGLKRISATVEKVVPIMALLYIIAGAGILILNLDKVPAAIALIFKSAFTPVAGVGGFAGATVRESIRYGVARGLYSNDAGTGYGMVAHASAKTDHPVRQSSWGWGEVFLDTIVVCSVTALSIIITNVYIDFPNITSAQLTTVAFKVVYGNFGGYFMGVVTTLFAWTTIVGMYYASEKSVNYFFGDSKKGKMATYAYMVYFIIPVIFFSNFEAGLLWAVTDLLSAIYVIVTLVLIYGKRKEIFRLFDEFWNERVNLEEEKIKEA